MRASRLPGRRNRKNVGPRRSDAAVDAKPPSAPSSVSAEDTDEEPDGAGSGATIITLTIPGTTGTAARTAVVALPNFSRPLNRQPVLYKPAAAAAAAPFLPRPQVFPSSGFRVRRALLIGIGYFATLPDRTTRPGSAAMRHVEGAEQLRHLLVGRFGYHPADVRVMTDLPGSRDVPTASNLAAAMAWLVRGARPGDRFFFAFGGHGKLEGPDVVTRSRGGGGGAERNSRGRLPTSVVMPSDHHTAGTISGAGLNAMLVRPLPAGSRLTALMLSCHSGSILGLPYSYSTDGDNDPSRRPPPPHPPHPLHPPHPPPAGLVSAAPLVVQFSASRDEEKSWAMMLRGTDGTARRAHMSIALYAFITALQRADQARVPLAYRDLLQAMQAQIRSLIDRAYCRQARQQAAYERGERAAPPKLRKVRPSVPQLSSSRPLSATARVKL